MIGHCRVCGATDIGHLCNTRNGRTKTTLIRHYRCSACGSVFVGNAIDKDELSAAYSSLDSKTLYEEIQSTTRKKMDTAIAHLKTRVPQTKSIIDIGTGNGLFVVLLNKAGYQDISAHEIGGDLAGINGIAHHIYHDDDYGTIPSDAFDAVTLLDVAEHVPDPGYLMKTCNRILKPDGVIYFHTPVVTKTDRMMQGLLKLPLLHKVGTIWQTGRTSIFHLENYTPKSLTLILDRAGFYDIEIEVKNELSWPVTRYIRTYLLGRQGLPGFLAPVLTPFLYPFLASNFFNPNKAIVIAKKRNNRTTR